jgi:glycosyl transferase family 87
MPRLCHVRSKRWQDRALRRERTVALGWAVAVAACSLPNVGLWRASGHANIGLFELYGRHVADGGIPYRSGFSFEYPPGAIPPLALPALPPGSYVVWFHVVELACLLAAVAAVAAVRRERWAVLAAAAAPALLGQLALSSFDLWPAALAATAVLLVVRGHPRAGAGFLAASTAAKLYPILLAPVLYTFVSRTRGRAEARRSLAVGTVVLAAFFLPFAILGPGGLRFSLQEQTTRGLQVESLGGSLFGVAHRLGSPVHVVISTSPFSYDIGGDWARAAAALTTIVTLTAVAAVVLALRAGPVDVDRTLEAVAATAVAFVAFGKVLSAQYLLFLIPLVPLVRRVRPLMLLGLALALTQVWARFPQPFGQVIGLHGMIWVTFVRNVVLVGLFADLLAELARTRQPVESTPALEVASPL